MSATAPNTMIAFDAAAARRVEQVYLTPDVVAQRCKVIELLAPRPNQRVLDVGCGPGLLLYDLAKIVGAGGKAVGIDISDAMLEMASARCEGLAQVDTIGAPADALPFADGHFDLAVSTQVHEYVQNTIGSLVELARVIRPGGRVLILDTAWDSLVLYSPDPDLTRRVLAAWDQHLAHPNLPTTLKPALRQAGFDPIDMSIHTIFSPYYHEHCYSASMVKMIGNYVAEHALLPEDAIADWKAQMLSEETKDNWYFALNRCLFTALRS